MTFDQLREIVGEISYQPWKITAHRNGRGGEIFYLQVSDPDGVCNVTGKPNPWKGRKWLVSQHATRTEVVYTALKAVLAAVEHEARENFRYRGVTICDPHISVDDLVALRQRCPLDGRANTGS